VQAAVLPSRARALLAVLFAMAVGLVLKAEAGAALLRL
jgi:hypothetical protein